MMRRHDVPVFQRWRGGSKVINRYFVNKKKKIRHLVLLNDQGHKG